MVEQIGNQQAQSAALKKEPEGKTQGESEFSLFGEDGFTFLDFVDMINPLQHIPVISTAYRQITGDEIDPGARLVGGTLFGGPIGLVASVANVALEANTGKDAGEHVLAMFEGEEVADQPVYAKQESFSDPNQVELASVRRTSNPEMSAEADALAAGQASLRMADIHDFMQPDLYPSLERSKALPDAPPPPVAPQGRGSAGTWAPTPQQMVPDALINHAQQEAPKPKEVANLVANGGTFTSVSNLEQKQAVPVQGAPADGLDALRAFARDMKLQQAQMQAGQMKTAPSQATPPPEAQVIGQMKVQRHVVEQPRAQARVEVSPPVASTRQMSQTDNNWFAQMMNQNMDRYKNQHVGGNS